MEPVELLLPMVTEENACLPLSVNVVAQYWGVDIPLPVQAAKVYSEQTGSVLIEGIEHAELHGLTVSILNTDLSGIRNAIDEGVPPIVILPGMGRITHHLSVISGYDSETITHYIPKSSSEGIYEGAIPLNLFEAKWAQEGQVAIMIFPEGRLDVSSSKSLRLCMKAERASMLRFTVMSTDLLHEAISADATNSTAWLMLASLQNEQNQAACVESYQKCLKLNDSCYLAYRGLGNHYLKIGNVAEAENNYTRAIDIDPQRSGTVYKNRAYIREKQADHAGAADDLASYVQLMPDAPDAGAMRRAVRELRKM